MPSSETAKGQVWEVTVFATAGNQETEAVSLALTIGNTAPEGAAVQLAPTTATTVDDLVATASGSDADDDTLTWSYSWTINGTPATATSDTLPSSETTKGDVVEVSATPSDGEAEGAAVTSNAVTIANTPPTEPVAMLRPVRPLEGVDDIVCSLQDESTDVDGDTLTYTITWQLDGAPYTGPTTTTNLAGDTVPASELVEGQTWNCFAQANDGDDDSEISDNSNTIMVVAPTALVPGNTDIVMSYEGWSVRCLKWQGKVCTHIQQRVDCGTCGTFGGCGTWHDTTRYNNGDNRTATNFCGVATGDGTVEAIGAGGNLTTEGASCGWGSSDHPICDANRATIHVDVDGVDADYGLLINPSYCDDDAVLLHVQCSAW